MDARTEWPLSPCSDDEPRLPSPLADDARIVEAIVGSPAAGAFLRKRLDGYLRFDHSPDSDRSTKLAELPRKARIYIADAIELVGESDGDGLDPDRIAAALVKIEKAGALLFAAYDRLRAAQAR